MNRCYRAAVRITAVRFKTFTFRKSAGAQMKQLYFQIDDHPFLIFCHGILGGCIVKPNLYYKAMMHYSFLTSLVKRASNSCSSKTPSSFVSKQGREDLYSYSFISL